MCQSRGGRGPRRFGDLRCGGRDPRPLLVDERGPHLAFANLPIVDEPFEKATVRGEAKNTGRRQHLAEPGECGGSVGSKTDELGQQRVVARADDIACGNSAINANAFAAAVRPARLEDVASGRHELVPWILRIETSFDGMAHQLHVALREAELLACGNPQLIGYEVTAGDELGHRVLDLQSCVQLKEVELAIVSDQEFGRAGAGVAGSVGELDRGLAKARAKPGRDHRGRRFLDDFLMATLKRAFALAEMDDVATCVTQQLDLDVARPCQIFLEHEPVIAKGTGSLAPRAGDDLVEFPGIAENVHAFAATARAWLDQHRKADSFCLAQQLRV